MRVYIAGPMKGYSDNNYPAFADAVREVSALGHSPLSPHTVEASDQSWSEFVRADLKLLLECEAIYMLRGWERSRGATLELHVATQVGMGVLFQDREAGEED